MASEVLVKASKINQRKKLAKIAKITSVSIFGFFATSFVVLSIIFKGGKFTISLDTGKKKDNNLIIYDSVDDPTLKRQMYADEMPFMDNISIKWLPKDIDTEKDGSHNGANYIAYTFYVENTGKETVNYWYEVIVDSVIKSVDDAIRIMIYVNGDKNVYAKTNEATGLPEEGTEPFYDETKGSKEYAAVVEKRENVKVGDRDRITVVIWLEGPDPECIDKIIGGKFKIDMRLSAIPNDEDRKK